MDLDIAIDAREKVRNPTMKLNKKLAIAIAALTKSEKKPFDELVTQEPTNKLIAVHFGVGDQDDYYTICNYVKQFGQNKVMIYPVRNYAFIEFQTPQQSLQLIQSLQIFENIVQFKQYFGHFKILQSNIINFSIPGCTFETQNFITLTYCNHFIQRMIFLAKIL